MPQTLLHFSHFCQERREKEKVIEAAKKGVAAAASEKRKPDPEQVKLAAETIAKDETEEGQASQECEVRVRYGAVRLGSAGGTVRHGTVRHGTARYGTVRCGTVRYGTARYGTVRHGTARYGTVRHGTARYGT